MAPPASASRRSRFPLLERVFLPSVALEDIVRSVSCARRCAETSRLPRKALLRRKASRGWKMSDCQKKKQSSHVF